MKPFQNKESLYGFASVFLGVATIVAIIVAVGQIKILDTDKYEGYNTISVSATGEAIAMPDVARVYFSVEDTQKTVAAAQTNVTKKINDVTEKLVALGVSKEKIKTESYSSYPKYEYRDTKAMMPCVDGYCPPVTGSQVLLGYTVTHSLSVTLKDTEQSGPALQLLGDAGVTNISGPNFEIENPDEVNDAARKDAIQKARVKAKAIAKDLGVGLGKVVGYSDDNMGYMYRDAAMSAKAYNVSGAESAPAPTLPVGESKVTSTVSVTFKIK